MLKFETKAKIKKRLTAQRNGENDWEKKNRTVRKYKNKMFLPGTMLKVLEQQTKVCDPLLE